jgi:hypothetical protein
MLAEISLPMPTTREHPTCNVVIGMDLPIAGWDFTKLKESSILWQGWEGGFAFHNRVIFNIFVSCM